MKLLKFIKKKSTVRYHQKSGRNNQGIITVRHRGGGLVRRINLIDHFHAFFNLEAIVLYPRIHDSFRTAFVSLILYKNGVFSYILKPKHLKQGDIIKFAKKYDIYLQKIRDGHTYPLRTIPEGIFVHSVQGHQYSKAKIARSAGNFVYIVNKFIILGNKILLRFRSREEYLMNCNSIASIGRLDNEKHFVTRIKKAGDNRRKGKRPHVRGVAMNPVDHPHGGNTSLGCQPVSPWGKSAKGGVRTRKRAISKSLLYKRRRRRKRKK